MAEHKTYSKARSIVAWIFGIYAAIVILFNMPFMQKTTAEWVANALSKQIGTKVEIGSVNLGFLDNIIIDDIYVEDELKKELLSVARVTASINIFKLIANGDIDISTAQLFGTHATLYKKTPDAKPNYQFIIDAFSSNDNENNPLIININSLIIRRANISYDVLSEPKTNTINPNHLNIHNAGMNVSLKCLSSDSVNCQVKRFQIKEDNSGLNIEDLTFHIKGNEKLITISDLSCKMPKSKFNTSDIVLDLTRINTDKNFTFGNTNISAELTPSDFAFILPATKHIDEEFIIASTLSCYNKCININNLSLSSQSNSLCLVLSGNISNFTESNFSLNTNINNLHIADGVISKYASLFTDAPKQIEPLFSIGAINYQGNIHREDSNISSDGEFITDAGTLIYEANINKDKILKSKITAIDLNLEKILKDNKLGKFSFNVEATADISQNHIIPTGTFNAIINNFEYNSYAFSDISINAKNDDSKLYIDVVSNDEKVRLNLNASVGNIESANKTIEGKIHAENISPYTFGIGEAKNNDKFRFDATTNIELTDIYNINGYVNFSDLTVNTNNNNYRINNLSIDALVNGTDKQYIDIKSDVADAHIMGKFYIDQLANNFQNIIAHHLPAVVKHKTTDKISNFNYNIKFYDSPLLHHYIQEDYSIDAPIYIKGNLDSKWNSMNIQINVPSITYNNNTFENVYANCNSSKGNMLLTITGNAYNNKSTTEAKIIAIAHNNAIDTDLQLHNKAKDNIVANLFATTSFANYGGKITSTLNFERSTIDINDSTWTISPSNLTYCDKQIECNHFRIANGNQFIEVDGKASSNPSDSLVLKINDVQVEYILDLVNFHSVEFAGMASGKATVKNIFDKPDANANLYVHNFSLEGGIMGDANILANWDRELEGISINAHIIDKYLSQYQLTGNKLEINGITEINGCIKPIKEELELHVLTNKTRADFLNGFLGGVLENIDGRITGLIDVVGPFGDINLIGTPKADISLILNATNVPYYIENEEIKLEYHSFKFEDITIHDKQNHIGILNGNITHRNFANMSYSFDVDMTNLCAYNESEFNSDKFLAQFWANGDIHIKGSDGHPLTIDANVTPCKGSVFAYDSATPDALVSNSFIDFRDITNNYKEFNIEQNLIDNKTGNNEATSITQSKRTYRGDIYMNVNVDLTPACEIKLRMDNTPDGYISTVGNGTFQAKWYNKGTFQLFGNYNITSGRYRLYLQDLVYRNLDIQDGSKVEFNGNPFDANIHLICKHEINSVPLSDLTTTTAFSSNNKVKVDCYLDITGHLNNMDLSFKFELPNVSEETRQLVRSMINSDEEMNKQMIYLLGFQRFYPNELAQSNIETYGTQAVNSLISSTISGQINQALSNMIGTRSKWNFGTGITTGENGWQDLDVEGILSGRLLNDRLLINGNFGYRDNSLTNQANFIGDFEVKYRIWETGDFFVKAYNQTNDRYFTKATLNTQGIGLSFQHDFEKYTLFHRRKPLTIFRDTIRTDTLENNQ